MIITIFEMFTKDIGAHFVVSQNAWFKPPASVIYPLFVKACLIWFDVFFEFIDFGFMWQMLSFYNLKI